VKYAKRYHDDFPAAPQALVAGVAAACGIPSIVGARVGKDDGSVYFDIFENDDFQVDLRKVNSIADFFDAPAEDVFIEPGPSDETITVSIASTSYDFSEQYRDHDKKRTQLPGEEDSEESIAAHVQLAESRRQ
jgi:hypothetical protein